MLSTVDGLRHNAGEMKRPTAQTLRTPLVFFSICAVVDFVLGLIRGRSVVSGVAAIVAGLPLTVVLFLLFRTFWKITDDSGMPHS